MIRVSTGFKHAVVAQLGALNAMQYGVIDVYTGSAPESPDEAPSGVRIARVTQGGEPFAPGRIAGGLALQVMEAGVVGRLGSWVLKGEDYGTAGWFRWKANRRDGDDFNPNRVRIDGTVGRELVLEDYEITPETELMIQNIRLYLANL